MSVPLARQIACIERELRMRRRVYPRWVEGGRMTADKSRQEIEDMEAVLATLRALPQEQGELLSNE